MALAVVVVSKRRIFLGNILDVWDFTFKKFLRNKNVKN